MAEATQTTQSASSGPTKRKQQGPQIGFTGANANRLPAELTDEQKADLAEAFKLLDIEGVNSITDKDLNVALRALGYEPQRDKVKKMVSDSNANVVSTTLSHAEFEKIMKEKLFDYENDIEIEKAFPLFTQGEKDTITIEDLRRVARELGENLPDEVFQEMVDEADVLDHDGQISYDEFVRVMKRQNAF